MSEPLSYHHIQEEPFYQPAEVLDVYLGEDGVSTFVEVGIILPDGDIGTRGEIIVDQECIFLKGQEIKAKPAGIVIRDYGNVPPVIDIQYEYVSNGITITASALNSEDWNGFLMLPSVFQGKKQILKIQLVPETQIDKPKTNMLPNQIVILSHIMSIASDICRGCPALHRCVPAQVGQYEEVYDFPPDIK